ncbi:uncharacterized protein ACB058_008523 isoform 1-T2 [Synchiropus picturatus]
MSHGSSEPPSTPTDQTDCPTSTKPVDQNQQPPGAQNRRGLIQLDGSFKLPGDDNIHFSDGEDKLLEQPLESLEDSDPNISVDPTVEEATREHGDLEGQVQADVAGDPAGVPALVITKAVESVGPAPCVPDLDGPAESQTTRTVVTSADSSMVSSCEGGDGGWSDSVSLGGESATCRRVSGLEPPSLFCREEFFFASDEDDTRSVTASSLTSLFHRVQLDPLEKDWMRSTALGNISVQRLLLTQDPSLVMKKTALHWAAKHGRQDLVDMMLQSGADVNIRSGYTPLHLAAIHGHQHIVHSLINTYNAKVSLRDYHGKMAAQYWKGAANVFGDHLPSETLGRRREAQRHVFPPLLSRSRSYGHLNMNFRPPPESHSLELYL